MAIWQLVLIIIFSVIGGCILIGVLNFVFFFVRPNFVKKIPILIGDEKASWIYKQNPKILEMKSFDGVNLKAIYIVHPNAKRIFIFNHGYTGSPYKDFGMLAKDIYDRYQASLIFLIQRGHYISNGHLISMGYKESQDVKLWCQYIENNIDNKLDKYLWGASMGTHSILSNYNYEYPKSIKAIIADCGYTIAKKMIIIVSRKMYWYLGILFYPFTLLMGNILGFSYIKNDTTKNVKNIKLPILFVHGKADRLVPTNMSVENYNAKEKGYKDLFLVDNADHICSYSLSKEEYLKRVDKLIKQAN